MGTVGAESGWAALFWTAFRDSRNAMKLLDDERVIVDVNDAWLELLGYERDEVVGQRIDRYLAPEEWRTLDLEWSTFVRTGTFRGRRAMVRKDGLRVMVQYAARSEVVSGRRLALYVALDVQFDPLQLADDDDADSSPLSPREIEVIQRVAMGLRSHEIAEELAISPSTVQTHLRNAMKKAGARSQAQLVAMSLALELF